MTCCCTPAAPLLRLRRLGLDRRCVLQCTAAAAPLPAHRTVAAAAASSCCRYCWHCRCLRHRRQCRCLQESAAALLPLLLPLLALEPTETLPLQQPCSCLQAWGAACASHTTGAQPAAVCAYWLLSFLLALVPAPIVALHKRLCASGLGLLQSLLLLPHHSCTGLGASPCTWLHLRHHAGQVAAAAAAAMACG